MILTDASIEIFVLKVEEDGGLFNFAFFEDLFDDFFATKAFIASFFENLGNDIGDGALAVTPFVERVDAAADEDEA